MKNTWTKIKLNKKWLFLGIGLIMTIAVGFSLQGTGKKEAVNTEKTIKVERGDIASIVSASGTVQPVNTVDISSKITAQIKEVKVKENDQVKAGQVLVILVDDDLQPQRVQAEEKMNNAAFNYERNKRLRAIGAVSEQQLDNARMDYNIAQANYEQVLSKLKETVISSPIDGIVIGKPLPAGQTVAQGISNPMVILTVADMSKMQIEALVDQTDIGKVKVGQKVTFTVDAYPDKKFTGTVSNISKKAVTQQNVIYYTAIIDVTNSQNLLNPGMIARVSISVGESKGTLTLPLSALRTDKNGKYVVVVRENGQTENVYVTTGIVGEDRVEIKSGLNEGDVVVIALSKAQGGQANGGAAGQKSGGTPGNPLGNMMRRQ